MKTRISFLIVLLMVLPLVLAACGGGPADTAKKYVEAIADGDADEAEKHVCDDNKDQLLDGPGEDNASFDVSDLECEEDGDDVKCTFKSDLGLLDEEAEIEMTFGMKDDKVCETKDMAIDGQSFGAPGGDTAE